MSHELLDLLNVRHDHVLCLEGTAPGHLNPRLHDRLNLLRVFNMQTVSRSLPHLWRFPYLGFSGISPSRCVRAAGALETAAVPLTVPASSEWAVEESRALQPDAPDRESPPEAVAASREPVRCEAPPLPPRTIPECPPSHFRLDAEYK